jgi:hypothetical protein
MITNASYYFLFASNKKCESMGLLRTGQEQYDSAEQQSQRVY